MKLTFNLLLFAISIFLLGFVSNVDAEETDKLDWKVLANVEWIWDSNFYQVNFNEKQKELDGREMIVEGFMFPLEYTRKHSNFLVSSSPMSDCFFCGPGEAESMVYVKTKEPIDYTHRVMAVKGTFRLVSDASMGIIYELDNAEVVRQ
ncbi:MAG: DUF3299 domain-containing protein [Balneolaceae bacterium]|nr:MAG: DUF3299 domain-containing protein [Balneolaceae bacterium]